MIPLYEPHLSARHKRAAIRTIESGWIGPGKRNAEFAAALGSYFGRHCTLANSGTSALMMALLALDMSAQATIACPDYGLPACQNAAMLLGHRVRLIDVNPATGCMDPIALGRYVNDNPCGGVVIFVDHNGNAGDDLTNVADWCWAKGGVLIEDSSVALGCARAGTVGDMAILSFSVPKIITTGQGGAVLSFANKYTARLSQLVDQGGGNWRDDRRHAAIGGNFRLADVQASLGLAQLHDLPAMLEKRTRLWDWYRDDMTIAHDVLPSGWMVTTFGKDGDEADKIIASVRAAGFDARRLYRPVHQNPPYARPDAEFPGVCDLYARLVYLPSSLNLTRKQVKAITVAVAKGRA